MQIFMDQSLKKGRALTHNAKKKQTKKCKANLPQRITINDIIVILGINIKEPSFYE